MLDDFTIENGATAIVPHSHKNLHNPPAPNAWCVLCDAVAGLPVPSVLKLPLCALCSSGVRTRTS
jgi:hypothetical protein